MWGLQGLVQRSRARGCEGEGTSVPTPKAFSLNELGFQCERACACVYYCPCEACTSTPYTLMS